MYQFTVNDALLLQTTKRASQRAQMPRLLFVNPPTDAVSASRDSAEGAAPLRNP